MTKPRTIVPLAAASVGIPLLLASCVAPPRSSDSTELFPESQKEVEQTLRELFQAAEHKDFPLVESMHLYGPKFSKFEARGAARLDAETTRKAERAGIEPLESFRVTFEDLKVDVFGETAIATFLMPYEAKASGQTHQSKVKATLVWVQTDSGWKIAHEHFSAMPASQ